MKSKNKNDNQKYKLTKEILLDILKVGGIFALIVLAPNAVQILKFFNKKYPKRDFINSWNYLKKQNYVAIIDKNDHSVIRLTTKGKKQAFKYFLNDLKIKKPKKWDNKWRLVVFDIPEAKRLARDVFRAKLKELGFLKLQDSVFILPYPCKKEINKILDFYNLQKYVYYIEAEKISSDDKIKKFYKIKPDS